MGEARKDYLKRPSKIFRPDDWMTTYQAAWILRVAPRTISKWCDAGTIPHIKLPGSKDRRMLAKNIINFMVQHKYPIPPELGGYYTFHVMIASSNHQLTEHLRTLPNNGERVGYRVIAAESAWKAAEVFMVGNVDLIVLDWSDSTLVRQIVDGVGTGLHPWFIELLPEDNCNHVASQRTRLTIQQPAAPEVITKNIRHICEGVSK